MEKMLTGTGMNENPKKPSAPGEQVDYALREAGSVPDASIRAYLMFHYASLVVNKVVDTHLSNWGLSVPRYAVLRGLLKKRSMTMVELSRYLMCNASNANSVVGRLVRDGFVKRESNPLDGRSTRVKLTPKGLKIAQEVVEPHRRFLIDLMAFMDTKDLQQFTVSIEDMISRAGDLSTGARLAASTSKSGEDKKVRKPARASRKLQASS
ncbi:winged helix DNA-binding protein [bacterium]|nr:winged helix DNA-binding protein [bacterium]